MSECQQVFDGKHEVISSGSGDATYCWACSGDPAYVVVNLGVVESD